MSYQQEMLNPSWTDEPLDTNVKIKKIHIEEIRSYLEELSSVSGCLQDYNGYDSNRDAPHDASLDGGYHSGFNTQHLHDDHGTYHHVRHDTEHADENSPVDDHDKGVHNDNVESGKYQVFYNQDYEDQWVGRYTPFNTCMQDFASRHTNKDVTVNTLIWGKHFVSDLHTYCDHENSWIFSSWDAGQNANDDNGYHGQQHVMNYSQRDGGVSPSEVYSCLYEGSQCVGNTPSGTLGEILTGQKRACQAHNMREVELPASMCTSRFCDRRHAHYGSEYHTI